jgi:hypothetical protein
MAVPRRLRSQGVWLTTFLHVVLRIRMSGSVPPFPIRPNGLQSDYITLGSEGSYDIRMTANYSTIGIWEIKGFGTRTSALTPKKA